MILLAYIARVSDGMLLVASMDTMRSGESDETLDMYKSQAREILKQLDNGSAAKCSIESGPLIFHYMISQGVCYLALTRKGYPKQLIFRYLDEIAQEFIQELARENHGDWKSALATAARPYAFIKFDETLQKKRREFSDPSARQNQSKLDEDISDIHNIMKRNIDQVLNRGEKLDNLVQTTSTLKSEAHKYKWGTKGSAMILWQQYAPLFAIIALILFVLYYKLRWQHLSM